MKLLLRFLAALSLGTSLGAAPSKPVLEFTRLDLLDGRKLRNVVVKSYDAKTGKVLLLADRQALTVSLGLIPPPFSESLRTGAPRSGRSTATVPAASPTHARAPSAPPPNSPARTYGANAPTDTPGAPSEPAPDLTGHKTAATERARKFYLAELRPGSDPSFTQVHRIELAEPQPITGWNGRYRTQGQATVEHFARGYRSLGRQPSTFEVVTEQKPNEPITVIDFTRKT